MTANKSLHTTPDGRLSSASRSTVFGPACVSSVVRQHQSKYEHEAFDQESVDHFGVHCFVLCRVWLLHNYTKKVLLIHWITISATMIGGVVD